MLSVTVSGSFHRFMLEIERVVQEFTARGVRILSPAHPKVVDHLGEFLFVASDRVRSIRLVQDRHLTSIAESDFVWLVSPDGYVGQSAAMEIGFAVARGIPVLSTVLPTDLTLRRYITKVSSIDVAIAGRTPQLAASSSGHSLLIDPSAAIESAHVELQHVERLFSSRPDRISDATSSDIYRHCASIWKTIQWPGGRTQRTAR
ncbi:MAG: hypothetical protein ACRD2A_00245 [Vicinamibacterales bacterium]